MRQICVIGLGQFGTHIARRLVDMGCEVQVIDLSEPRVAAVKDDVQRALIVDARSLDALQSVLSESIEEVVVSLGESVEASILCTLHLHQLGVKSIRAKAINDDHATILRAVGATDVFFPERETAERMARRIAHPTLLDFFPFAEDYRIAEVVAPAVLVGRKIAESGLRSDYGLLALALRDGKTEEYRFMPEADTVIAPGDVLIVLGREVNLARLSALD